VNARTTPPGVLAGLATRFGDRLSTSHAIRDRHGQDESYHAPSAPDAVVYPRNAIDTLKLLREKK
jgi:D-lactate dehydrogenase (cytochrome)